MLVYISCVPSYSDPFRHQLHPSLLLSYVLCYLSPSNNFCHRRHNNCSPVTAVIILFKPSLLLRRPDLIFTFFTFVAFQNFPSPSGPFCHSPLQVYPPHFSVSTALSPLPATVFFYFYPPPISFAFFKSKS